MAYDRLAESIRLIDGAPVCGPEPLTRRRRFLPVAVDVDRDVAVTVFLRRAHGGAAWESHLLCRAGGRWHLLGGGGWELDELDVLTRIPTPAELGGPAQADGGGGVAVSSAVAPESGARWLNYTMIKTTDAVGGVSVAGRRTIPRPAHGHIAVVWGGHERLPVTVTSRDGRALSTLHLDSALA